MYIMIEKKKKNCDDQSCPHTCIFLCRSNICSFICSLHVHFTLSLSTVVYSICKRYPTFKLHLLIQYFVHFVAVVTFMFCFFCCFLSECMVLCSLIPLFIHFFVQSFIIESYTFTHLSNICPVLPFNTCN